MNKQSDLSNLLASDKPMELTALDICKVIRSCRDNGVRLFRYGDLEITFRALIEKAKPSLTPHGDKPIPDTDDKSNILEEERALLTETVIQREDQLAQLVIDDPEQYEDLASSGDLVDAESDDS